MAKFKPGDKVSRKLMSGKKVPAIIDYVLDNGRYVLHDEDSPNTKINGVGESDLIKEDSPYQKKRFLDTGTYVADYEKKEEGFMGNKIASMTEDEVAEYILRHPHTKYIDKVKEGSGMGFKKALLRYKKTNEDFKVGDKVKKGSFDVKFENGKSMQFNLSPSSQISLSESYMIKWNDSYIAIKGSNSTTDNKKEAYKYNSEDDAKKDLEYIKLHFKNPIKWYNVKLEIVNEGFGDNAIKRYFTAYKNKNNFKGTLDDFIRMYQKGEIKEDTVKQDNIQKIKNLKLKTGLKGDALAQAAYEKWGWDVAYLINDPLSKHLFESKVIKEATKEDWANLFKNYHEKAMNLAKDQIISNLRWNAKLPNIFDRKEWDNMTAGAKIAGYDKEVEQLWKSMSKDKTIFEDGEIATTTSNVANPTLPIDLKEGYKISIDGQFFKGTNSYPKGVKLTPNDKEALNFVNKQNALTHIEMLKSEYGVNGKLVESKQLKESVSTSDLQKAANAVKGVSFMSMRAPLEKVFGKGKVDSNYSVWIIKSPSGTIGITSEKNADKGPNDILQDGFIIGSL